MKPRSTIEEINEVFGKIPPQAVEVEEAVLGALMLEQDAYISIAEIIDTRSFYKLQHQQIFEIIKSLSQSNKPIDLLMVTQELRNRGLLDEIGGPLVITKLTSKVVSAAHIEFHARIIAQKFIQREMIRISSEIQIKAYDDTLDVDDLVNETVSELVVIQETGKSNETTISEGVDGLEKRITWNQANTGLSGIGTGFYKFDKFSGGLQKTDLLVIAGESSQGKTSLALTITKNAVMNYKARAAIYSLEMDKIQLVARLVAQETGISSKRILTQKLSPSEINRVSITTRIIKTLPVFFDESSTSSIDQICTSMRRLKMKYGINLAVVDYLQLVGSGLKNKSDEAQIAEIARRLKNAAKDLGISVIAISQLSRTTNGNHRPTKSRLRGSGQIEEAADVVMTVWRPETYEINEFDEPHKGILTFGLAECLIEKGRNIGTGSFLLKFNKETTSFYDYLPDYELPAQKKDLEF
ncbi:replicative DNA helicase [Mangrovibacterium diazotrophicum]|uniref:DNA 5'-3' helicase n=1 Tax=Mangrovibacterium diazotrophicum TaxID=1261403 RepID=A0A419W3K4_9BACT|nr:replicative DNA helicase [Mangrovibacterium diazotrophicum]RKD90052.1 replicative DNA helicase [Mangrovibacterium diazotrophicum]